MTTWIDLEGIMLSEASQTEKDKYFWFHLHSESKKQNKQQNKDMHKNRTNQWSPDRRNGGGGGETGEGD